MLDFFSFLGGQGWWGTTAGLAQLDKFQDKKKKLPREKCGRSSFNVQMWSYKVKKKERKKDQTNRH